MTDLTFDDIEKFNFLIKLKKEDSEGYKQFWADLKEVIKDMMKLSKEIAEEIDDA